MCWPVHRKAHRKHTRLLLRSQTCAMCCVPHIGVQDYAFISLLAMGGAYLTNWALNYLNYTTRIVFKSSRVLPVMAFRTLVVGQRYNGSQYCAGLLLVMGIALFSMGDAQVRPGDVG